MKAITKSPSYLIRNPYSYCFRMVVPTDLQRLVGKKELRYSLRTGYIGVAKHKARLLAGQVHYVFKSLRTKAVALSVLSDEKIQNLVSQYIRGFLERLEESYYNSDTSWETAEDYRQYVNADLDFYKERTAEFLGMGDYSSSTDKVVGMLEKNGVDQTEKDSVPYIKLCRELLKADLKLLDVEKRRLTGDYSYQNELSDLFPAVFPKHRCQSPEPH